jgi:hypothetical protein
MNLRRRRSDERLSVVPRRFDPGIGSGDNAMRRAIIACALLFAGTFAAQAYHSNDTYRDLVRPNGQPRSDAVFQADISFCYRQIGGGRFGQDTSAFKQCMLSRKWQWESVRIVRDGPSRPKSRPDCFDLTFDCGFKNY